MNLDCTYLRIVKIEKNLAYIKCSKGLLKNFKCPSNCPYYRKFNFSGIFILIFVFIGAVLGLLFNIEFSILGILIGGFLGYNIERFATTIITKRYQEILSKYKIVILS